MYIQQVISLLVEAHAKVRAAYKLLATNPKRAAMLPILDHAGKKILVVYALLTGHKEFEEIENAHPRASPSPKPKG